MPAGQQPDRSEASAERMVGAMHDIAARLNGIIQSTMDAIITVDEHQDILIFNPAAEQMFGCAGGDVTGTPLGQFIPPRFRDAHRAHIEHFGATGVTTRRMGVQSEIVGLRANGQEFPVEASISQVAVGGRKLFTVILRDITERKRAERELRESREQLRQLSASLLAVREEEKARIARELHDELGQALTGIKMDLAQLAVRLTPEQPGAIDRVNAMSVLIESTVASVRRLATELRPLMLDDLGLVPTIEWLVGDFSKRTGIAVQLSLPDSDLETHPELSTALFRVLQESLTNVARHARASHVRVELTCSDIDVRLTVRDDGVGISARAENAPRSFGLLGMRERAAILGGTLSVDSSPSAGTSISMVVPLARDAAEAPR
jgi:two-component system, NarL family, sensor histidine kinase UhpB